MPKRPDPVPYQHANLMMPTLADGKVFERDLKFYLLDRDSSCRSCGGSLIICHLHEGLISKNDVAKWPKRWKILIRNELNCILLCGPCNLGRGGHPPPRYQVWQEQCELYGKDIMRAWLSSLPLKSPPAWT